LNGYYYGGSHISSADGIEYYTLSGHQYSLFEVTMKIRPKFKCINSTVSCSGQGKCGMSDVCTCSVGYIGNNCEREITCFSKSYSDPTVCSGK
jgi:hypothetical protein